MIYHIADQYNMNFSLNPNFPPRIFPRFLLNSVQTLLGRNPLTPPWSSAAERLTPAPWSSPNAAIAALSTSAYAPLPKRQKHAGAEAEMKCGFSASRRSPASPGVSLKCLATAASATAAAWISTVRIGTSMECPCASVRSPQCQQSSQKPRRKLWRPV
eukprot:scaffold789_cov261-Pinguiococcus_pyrenoidosus.AAC.18